MKYKVGDVERILGLSAETLRFFEKKGVITPERDQHNGYRYYDTLDLNKLVAYKFYRGMEFSMDEAADLINSLSVSESMDQLKKQQAIITEKRKHYELLERRMEELRTSFLNVENNPQQFQIVECPELLLYFNQVNDVFAEEGIQQEVNRAWLQQLPFVWLALHIPKEEIPEGNVLHWGYAIRTEYQEIAVQLRSPLTRRIPSQKSVYTVFKCRKGMTMEPKMLQSALDFMHETGLELNGDAVGCIIHEEEDCFGTVRYFEIWLPVLSLEG